MENLVINNESPVEAISAVPNEADLGGIRLLVLPPGPTNAWVRAKSHTFDVNLNAVEHSMMCLNSDRLIHWKVKPNTCAFFPRETEFRVQVEDTLPGLLLEVADETFETWLQQAELDGPPEPPKDVYRPDAVVADLGRAAIRYLVSTARRNTSADRLTVEAMALAIVARGMAQMSASDGNIDAELERWAARCRRSSIDRAVDCLEARLTEGNLRIKDLADAAAMSSSHFSSAFKAALGETPHGYILRRRAEFARDLIMGTYQPLGQIAYAAGFSSQAHMTTVFKRIFKATPGEVRG